MHNKNYLIGICIFIFLSFSTIAQCDFLLPTNLNINQGESYEYNINRSDLFFTWAPINFSIKDFSISKTGLIKTTPENDKGQHTLLVIATSQEGCYEVSKLVINVLEKPQILNYSPEKNLAINETQSQRFKINAKSDYELRYEWYLDGKKQNSKADSFILITNYSFSGRHTLIGYAIDSRNLNSSVRWIINIRDQNRGPYVKYSLPNFIITINRKGVLFNINNYIFDPDNDKLEFNAYFLKENLSETSELMDIVISNLGDFSVFPKKNIYLTEHVVLKVSDGTTEIYTDPLDIEIASTAESFEYFSKSVDIERCIVSIKCGEWSECFSTEIRTRVCYDKNNCNGENNTLVETEECEYGATCTDKILNQGEEEIDCGGPCKACPTCYDQIKNQGEEEIDCGGPCTPCPNCHDLIKNQDETDIDCGGICDSCGFGKSCEKHTDCQSLLCSQGTCTEATCFDNRQNQGEERIDCGGPCEPCATCTDNILNQGEERIDCGGPCKSCTSCNDGKKNQGEWFKDCGGPCDCGWLDFVFGNWIKLILITLVFVFFIVLNSYKNKNKTKYLIGMSRFVKFLPVNLKNLDKTTIETINKLKKLQYSISSKSAKEIDDEYEKTISDYFVNILESEDASRVFVKNSLKKKVKNPYLRQYLMDFYYYVKHNLSSSPLYKIEMSQKIDYTISKLNRIKQNV